MAPSKKSLKARWDGLAPKKRRQITLACSLGFVLLLAFAFVSTSNVHRRGSAQSRIANALMPTGDADDLGVSGLSKNQRGMQNTIRQLQQSVSQLRDGMKRLNNAAPGKPDATDPVVRNQLKALHQQIAALQTGDTSDRTFSTKSSVSSPPAGAAREAAPPGATRTSRQHARTRSSAVAGPEAAPGANAPQTGVAAPNSSPVGEPPDIRTVTEPLPKPASSVAGDDDAVATSEPPKIYIPSGSMLTGVMITGLDAATGRNAMSDPIPALIRIKHDAILPNRYRADVKECFLLASGHGDLASERAYLRAVKISCVRDDKSVIDIPLKGYAIGADGKAGIRGRLVSKQGSLIAKAAVAGMAQGISQAFSSNTNRFGNRGTIDYGATLQSGATSGVGSAFDRIAKYYLDLADQIFPVIEIDAGQPVSFVMVSGSEMTALH